jgi:hypothetical protein
MFKEPEDHQSDIDLRAGLRQLAVPEASPDFNARIHAALRRPLPWWQALWVPLRPLLTSAVCSLAVMSVLLHWSSRLPTIHPPSSAPANVDGIADSRILERADLSAASLIGLPSLQRSWKANTAEVPEMRTLPRHAVPGPHAQLRTPPIA